MSAFLADRTQCAAYGDPASVDLRVIARVWLPSDVVVSTRRGHGTSSRRPLGRLWIDSRYEETAGVIHE